MITVDDAFEIIENSSPTDISNNDLITKSLKLLCEDPYWVKESITKTHKETLKEFINIIFSTKEERQAMIYMMKTNYVED